MEHYKISKLLNDSIISKFVRKKWIEVNETANNRMISSKTTSKSFEYKAELIETTPNNNNILDAVAKSNDNKIVKAKDAIDENLRNIEEIIIPAEKREEMLNKLRQVL